MTKRKAYVRVTETITEGLVEPIEIVAGVELHRLQAVSHQYRDLRETMRRALAPGMLHNYSDADLAGVIEMAILRQYPVGTSYFIEIGRGKMDEYVQVFLP